MSARDLLRQLPAVDELLRRPALAPLWRELGPAGARHVIAAVLAELRADPTPAKLAALDASLAAAAHRRLQPSLRPVINATGVILHTNLGRAPLSPAAAARLAEVAASYTNLELDLATGLRARRDRHLDPLLAELTGAEASLVVNNNAAAVLLAVHTLAVDLQGEVLVSRGELVEIGESFRIADIVARGGARLVEVGSTNRTRLADYAAALTPATRLILRVHRSNFVQTGFVEQPELAALAAFAHEHALPLLEDLGSGALVPLPALPSEPTVAASLRAGVDLVAYSGDKLLGGPQAGLLSGRAPLLARLRANPLFRALRVDKLTLAALEATLAAYARGDRDALPVFALAAAPALEARVRAFAAQLPPALGADILAGESLLGGGSTPGQSLPAWLIALPPNFAPRLRLAQPPVLARLERDRCLLDLRTVFPHQQPALLAALRALL
ncbi:MAG TPA: L-seryl-tRNA(Sec) selenium transferase [Terriglobales bacterium]|nr:L-seryl-tRNA(Sec) selenium transferase [Terriglobales bacterium]